MKKFEHILWIIVATGLLLKVFRLPFSSLLLILSLSSLAMVCFFRTRNLFPETEQDGRVRKVGLLAGIVLSIGLIGILFKIQLWPMSGLYLLVGSVGIAALVVILFTLRSSRPDLSPYIRGLLMRAIPLMVVCIGFYAIPGGTLTAFYYRNDPELAPLMIQRNTTSDPKERVQLDLRIDSIHEDRFRLENEQRTSVR